MRSRLRRLRAPVAAIAAAALVALGPGAASADEAGPVEDFVGEVEQKLDQNQPEQDAAEPSPDGTQTDLAAPSAPAPSTDDDLPGHETEDPAPPDHAGAEVADVDIADEDVADVAHNDATVEDDDSTRADSTLLALGGEEVLGAHAESSGENEAHFGDPLAPLCEGSEGAVCLRVLYADAYATDDGSTSHSRSQSGVADVCLGGSSADPTAECDGPVGAEVASSSGEAERNQSDGRTTASSESQVADVCLQPDAATGGCALGVGAAHSEGRSDSGGVSGEGDRDSYLLAVDAGGEEQGRVGDPTSIALQPECAEPSLLCAFLNQGETYTGPVAGHAQEALSATVLPGTPLVIEAELARTESLVHNDGGDAAADGGNAGGGAGGDVLGAGGPGMPGAGAGGGASVAGLTGVLPNTGGVWSGLLALGLFGVAAGAFSMALGRRRALTFS